MPLPKDGSIELRGRGFYDRLRSMIRASAREPCLDCGNPAETVRYTAAGDRPRAVCATCALDMDRERALLRGSPHKIRVIRGPRGSV